MTSSFEEVVTIHCLAALELHGRRWAIIRLSHHPEVSGHALHGVDGLDIGGRHGRRFVQRNTRRQLKGPYPICASSGDARHQSRHHEGTFGGLAPPDKAPSLPNWNMKHYNQLSFCQIFDVKPSRTNPKPPRRNANPLYWKLSGDGSVRFCPVVKSHNSFAAVKEMK